MNKELRRVSGVVLILFLALFSSTTIVQFFQNENLQADPRNSRTLYASFSTERGAILVADSPVARSVDSDDEYNYQREYTEGRLYAHTTGYYTLDQGDTGVEAAYDELLSGTANSQFFDRMTAIFTGQEPQGATVSLTLDPQVQRAAWRALGDYTGAVVAIEPSTGKILAMVSKPSFDPNQLAVHNSQEVIDRYDALLADDDDPLINRAIAGDLNAPGSTFKLVVASAALESGDYTSGSTFANPSQLQLPNTSSVIGNSGGGTCGSGNRVSIATAIQLSCNIPFAELGRELGYDAIAEQAAAFGFGDDSFQIPMQVTASQFPEVESTAQLMLQSFGQGNDLVTPLQMAMVSSALANDGVLMRPTVVDEVTAPDLSVIEEFAAEEYSQATSAETANAVTEMMVSSVAAGAASNATIDGVEVAGKTGTAENGDGEPYTLWFTGFAPADDPQVAVAVVIEDGGGIGQSGFGNTLAAPVAKQVMEAVIGR